MSGEHHEDGLDAPAKGQEDDAAAPGEGAPADSPAHAISPELEEALEQAAASVGGDADRPSASEAVTESLLAAKKELEEALEQTKREAASLRDNWMRAAADLENYRRRAAKEREDVKKFGIEKLLQDFLPVFDDLERALGAIGGTEEHGQAKQLVDGIRLVHKKFLSTLGKNGVVAFESAGETFDPERHEAVQQVHADVPAGKIATEIQKGFMIHERLLRPALVVVSLGPAEGENA